MSGGRERSMEAKSDAGRAAASKEARGGGNFGGKSSTSSGGKQVYSGPVGPTTTGGVLGGNQHFSQQGTGLGGLLDKAFGYENVGQRVNALNNNPSYRGNQKMTGMIPSFPNAPLGYALAALASAPTGPIGFATRIADIAMGGTGHGMLADAMAAQGMGPGPRGPDVPGGGRERGGQGGALDPNYGGALKQPYQPLSNPQSPALSPQTRNILSMEYPGQNVPISGPSPYSYSRPSYRYYG